VLVACVDETELPDAIRCDEREQSDVVCSHW
jgi:hypothetical protein